MTAPAAPATPAVRCENLVHVYGTPGNEVAALRGVDLVIEPGEMVALLGPSGAGKTTLLWHLAGLLKPTAGTVEVGGRPLSGFSGRALTSMRLREVGLLLQNPASNLLPSQSATGNVLFAQAPTRRSRRVKRRRAADLLDRVGLASAAHRTAGLLSGGEQQRLAVAVALANGPRLLLADEPTSQLDPESAGDVIELIQAANASLGTTVVAVTHDPEVAAALGRTITIRDGRVGAAGHGGREFMVVGKDGTVTLPPDLLDEFPPGSLATASRADAMAAANTALAELGLGDYGDHLVQELSGGQQQRVAVARALAARPELLIADEPTAEQDAVTRELVLARLLGVVADGGALVLATHDPEVVARCDHVVSLARHLPARATAG
jgi:putative ABC transport system ATP-binding protein